MNKNLAVADYIVFIVYFIIVASYGYAIYRKRKKMSMMPRHTFLQKVP